MTEINEIFKEINSRIELSKNYFDILTWNSFDIDFSIDFENRKQITEKLKREIGNVAGFYSIYDEENLYIGIGRPIWSRIKLHYYASQEKDKAEKWVKFFKKNKKVVKIYWKEFSVSENKKIDDKLRQFVESILTEKYKPKFENE